MDAADEDAEDLPGWVPTAFWVLVLVFNVAVFFTAVGPMVIGFRGDWTVGGAMLFVGLVAWAVGIAGYRYARPRLPDG